MSRRHHVLSALLRRPRLELYRASAASRISPTPPLTRSSRGSGGPPPSPPSLSLSLHPAAPRFPTACACACVRDAGRAWPRLTPPSSLLLSAQLPCSPSPPLSLFISTSAALAAIAHPSTLPGGVSPVLHTVLCFCVASDLGRHPFPRCTGGGVCVGGVCACVLVYCGCASQLPFSIPTSTRRRPRTRTCSMAAAALSITVVGSDVRGTRQNESP